MNIIMSSEARKLHSSLDRRSRGVVWFLILATVMAFACWPEGSAGLEENLDLEVWKRRHDVERLQERLDSLEDRVNELQRENKRLTEENAIQDSKRRGVIHWMNAVRKKQERATSSLRSRLCLLRQDVRDRPWACNPPVWGGIHFDVAMGPYNGSYVPVRLHLH